MFARVMWVLGLSTVTLGAIQACGSDSSGATHPDEHDASTGGTSGAGGNTSGGKAGMGGGSAAGGMGMLGCDTSACDQQLAPITQALGGIFTLKSCCVSATKCGIDTSAFGAILGTGIPACLDPSAITGALGDASIPPPPPGITVLDGGIIPVTGDGGVDIHLDKSCPNISSQGTTAQGLPVSLDLPGCCRPEGFCGGSTHTLLGAGTTVPLLCLSYDEAASAASSAFGSALTIPDDPRIKCSYTAAPPDASVDSGSPPKPEPDAAPPSQPDAAPPEPDAASTSEPDTGSPPNPQ